MASKIIAIGGVARSGTSWLGQIFDSSEEVVYRFQPFFSYAFKNRISHETTQRDYQIFFAELEESKDAFLTQIDKRKSGYYPEFIKSSKPTTLVFKENRYQYLFPKMIALFPELKFLGIIRNPNAVINSWIKNPKEFPPGSNIHDEWRFGACKNKGLESEFFGFYKWREVANLYLDLKDKHPDQVYIIRYEDLVENPLSESRLLFDFAGLKFSEQTISFINDSTSKIVDSPYAVYKNKEVIDKWTKELPPSITTEIYSELKGTRLEKFLE